MQTIRAMISGLWLCLIALALVAAFVASLGVFGLYRLAAWIVDGVTAFVEAFGNE